MKIVLFLAINKMIYNCNYIYDTMDYYSNYISCKKYYKIYNKHLKSHEYLKYQKISRSGVASVELYTLGFLMHNIAGPAEIRYYDNGIKSDVYYYINGILHNISEPAHTIYRINGIKSLETYYIKGRKHRINGPAEIKYYYNDNGAIYLEYYWINDERYNANGPVLNEYDINGENIYHNMQCILDVIKQ